MNNASKSNCIIEKILLELGLCFLGITLGSEIHNYQHLNRCKKSLINYPIISQYVCKNSSFRERYLPLIDEKNDLLLAYQRVLKEDYNPINFSNP